MNIQRFKIRSAKAIIIGFVLAFGLNLVAEAGQTSSSDAESQTGMLTLDQAKKIALEKNPSIAAAMERINQARESLVQVRAGYLPTVTGTAGWDYTEKTLKSSPEYDETQHSGRISVTQMLFDGFYTKYSVLASQNRQEMNTAAHEDEKRILSWSVAQAFLNTQFAQETIKIARSDMKFNKKQEIEAIAKEKSGQGSYSDVLNFKTKVNTAASSLLSARQDLVEAKAGLSALMGYKDARLPHGMAIAPLPEKAADTAPIDADSSLEDILSSRPDLKEAFLAVREADADIKSAQASYYPKVSLSAGYGTNTGDHIFDHDNMGAAMGINISLDIFSGGVKKSKVTQAKSRKRELEKNLEYAKINAVSNIRTAIDNIAALRQKLALQKENTALIESARDLVEKEYRAGQASLVRLNEAQNDLVNAQGTLSKNKVSLILALEELDCYIGNNLD